MCVYVGKTTNPKCRLRSHRCVGSRSGARLKGYLAEMRSRGAALSMCILEVVSGENWTEAEKRWIALIKPLCNIQPGGQPGKFGPVPEATRKLLRERNLGKVLSLEVRAKVSAGLMGKKQSSETVRKRLETINRNRIAKGLPPRVRWESEEAQKEHNRRRIKEYKTAKRREQGVPEKGSAVWNAAVAARQKAFAASLSDKERLRRFSTTKGRAGANRGRKFGAQSEEHRAKTSQALKLRLALLTPEQREQRMSAARAARKAKLGY